MNVAKLLCFLVCIACEVAGDGVICLTGYHEVERNRRELHGCAALHKQNAVVVRDIIDAAQNVLRTVDNIVVVL